MTGPAPAVAAARHAVRHALADLEPGALVLVACSGGADSLALAAATAFVARRAGLRAGAVVVDHGLQTGSDAVAARAAATCRDLGLAPVEVVPVHVAAAGGPEAAARSARHEALAAAATRTGARAILLGHTLDDQAETVLLRLARGSGARSLAGMPAVRGLLRRPLLGLRRADTEAVCAALGLAPWHDPTNATGPTAPRRSRVRHEVLPVLTDVLGPGVVPALARTAAALALDDAALAAAGADLLARATGAGAGADADLLAAAPAAVRRRAVRDLLAAAGVPGADLGSTHVLGVDALLADWRGQGPVALPGGREARRACGRLTVDAAGSPRLPRKAETVDHSDMGADLENILLTQDQLHARLDELAAQIDTDYAGRELLLVGVLKGAVMVMADLARRLHTPLEMDWMAVSSYGAGTSSSGVVRILKDLDTDLTGRHVLIVEDIIDSGLTLSWLEANLRTRGPASVEIAAMLRKPDAAKVEVDVRYVGFDIPPEFVVGYGLDYAERYRNLPFVGTLAPHVYRD